MGGCCCFEGDDPPEVPVDSLRVSSLRGATIIGHPALSAIRANPGPTRRRRCTDPLCCVLLLAVVAVLCVGAHFIGKVSDRRIVQHDMDHEGNVCGFGSMVDRPYAYFPDLYHDVSSDPSLLRRYSICVSACPEASTVVDDYGAKSRQPAWFVLLPSFQVLGRCVPYAPVANASETLLCAMPPCNSTQGLPTTPQEVCGLQRDGTDKFWLLSPADESMRDGWSLEGANESLVDARSAIARAAAKAGAKSRCLQPLKRASSVQVRPLDEEVSFTLFTSVTGQAFEFISVCSEYKRLVLTMGVGGGFLLSLLVISLFPCCAHVAICISVLIFALVLIATDYILFMKAGMLPGVDADTMAHDLHIRMPADAESLFERADSSRQSFYLILGMLLLVAMAVISCLLCAMQQDFKRLAGLLTEASHVIRAIPSMFIFSYLILAFVMAMGFLLLGVVLSIATVIPNEAQPAFDALHLNSTEYFVKAQIASASSVMFVFLWGYYFAMAMLNCTIAHSVARWYFQDDGYGRHAGCSLSGLLGVPLINSCVRVCKYHLGSLAKGSLLIVLCTVPRIILEYIDRHIQGSQGNIVTKAVVKVGEYCFWFLEQFLKFITKYAYVYVAIESEPFCPAARKTMELLLEYPLLLALEQWTCFVLCWITCVAVPLTLVLSLPFVGLQTGHAFDFCAVAVAGLAFVTARVAMGTYDSCITALLVCVARDARHCNSNHMCRPHMTQELRSAFGLREDAMPQFRGMQPPLDTRRTHQG